MQDETREILSHPPTEEGASEEAIRRLLEYTTTTMGTALPADYLEFLRFTNGAEGPIGDEGYVSLWAVEELPEANEGYQTAEWMPGFFIIGSSGGNAAYGIDTRSRDVGTMAYIETDFVAMGWDAVFWQGATFCELLRHIRDD